MPPSATPSIWSATSSAEQTTRPNARPPRPHGSRTPSEDRLPCPHSAHWRQVLIGLTPLRRPAKRDVFEQFFYEQEVRRLKGRSRWDKHRWPRRRRADRSALDVPASPLARRGPPRTSGTNGSDRQGCGQGTDLISRLLRPAAAIRTVFGEREAKWAWRQPSARHGPIQNRDPIARSNYATRGMGEL